MREGDNNSEGEKQQERRREITGVSGRDSRSKGEGGRKVRRE